MKLKEIAEQINAYLKRFESTKKINKLDRKYKTRPYYHASARQAGSKVAIIYISFQTWSHLSKTDAERYLAWLDADNVGKHFDCSQDQDFRYKKTKDECAGCGATLGIMTVAHVRIGTKDGYLVCGGRSSYSGYEPKKACFAKARAKLARCPGCDGEDTEPGTICRECHAIIDRGQSSGEEPTGYLLDETLLGPYLSDRGPLLKLLCIIAAPEGHRRWDRSLPDWARTVLGDKGTRAHTGMPGVELDESQKDALLSLCAEIEKLMKNQRREGIDEGGSVLHRIMNGELSVSDINEMQDRADRRYGEKE